MERGKGHELRVTDAVRVELAGGCTYEANERNTDESKLCVWHASLALTHCAEGTYRNCTHVCFPQETYACGLPLVDCGGAAHTYFVCVLWLTLGAHGTVS